jgi:DNA-binding MarR family transcriptional regulator
MLKKLKKMDNPRRPVASDRKARAESIEAILKALRVTYQSVQAHSQHIEKMCGVSAAQLWAMWELHKTPGMSVSDLASTLLIHRSTSSNMLDKLERKKLIRRERTGPDQRVVRLYLTSAGHDLLTDAPRPAQGLVVDALQQLPDKVLHCLSSDLSSFVELLKIRNQRAASIPLSERVRWGAAAE